MSKTYSTQYITTYGQVGKERLDRTCGNGMEAFNDSVRTSEAIHWHAFCTHTIRELGTDTAGDLNHNMG